MKKMYIAGLAIAIIGGVALIGWQTANAHNQEGRFGFHRAMENKASALDMSVEELGDQLENSSFQQIIEQEGLTRDEFHTQMKEGMRSFWSEIGLTEDEISAREQFMNEKHENCDGNGEMGMHRKMNGPGGGWWKQ